MNSYDYTQHPTLRNAPQRHIISVDQFGPQLLDYLFKRAAEFKKSISENQPIDTNISTHDPVISFFIEPSTRTRFSSEAAAMRLGLNVIGTESGKMFSSLLKGESLADTARNLAGYRPSVVISRTAQAGDGTIMAQNLNCPSINAGDGTGEHPTQALLDAFTIQDTLGSLDGLKIAIGGDLANGRTARSLVKLMNRLGNNSFVFISPSELSMGQDILTELDTQSIQYTQTESMNALADADVVYWTRLQAERFDDPEQKRAMIARQADFTLTAEHAEKMKDSAIIMHPLPRVQDGFIDTNGDALVAELHENVDANHRAKYFEQSENGMYVRMALIEWCLSS